MLYNTINCHSKISHKHRRHGKLGYCFAISIIPCLVIYIASVLFLQGDAQKVWARSDFL